MKHLTLNPVEIATRSLLPFRQILDEVVKKRGLKIPQQLDMTVDCVLMAHFLTYAHNIFKNGFYSDSFENQIVDHIYEKNIKKIMSTSLSESDYSFNISNHIPDYKIHYFKIDIDKTLAKNLILLTIKSSQKELINILESYKNGDKKIPKIFFFNCFIHPTGMIPNSIKSLYDKPINEHASEVCDYLLVEIRLYLQDVIKRLEQMNNDLNK